MFCILTFAVTLQGEGEISTFGMHILISVILGCSDRVFYTGLDKLAGSDLAYAYFSPIIHLAFTCPFLLESFSANY